MSTSSDREQSRLFSPMSDDIEPYRIKPIARIVYSNPFELTIVSLIILNAAALGTLTFQEVQGDIRALLETFDSAVIWIFVLELALRVASYGRKPWMFFTSGWNIFDFLVIALIPVFAGNTIVLRLLRLLRVVRIFRFMPEFRILTNSLARSIKPLLNLLVLIGFLMFLFAMAGVYLFGDANPDKWGDLGAAMVTLTILLTLENFPESLAEGLGATPFAWLYFLAFMFFVVFTVLNVLIGIVLNAMDEARAEAKTDDETLTTAVSAIATAHGESKLTADMIEQLRRITS